jgi:hypothetical protein
VNPKLHHGEHDQLHGPVMNQTGLTGKYDIALNRDARGPGEKVPEGDERGPDLIQTIH